MAQHYRTGDNLNLSLLRIKPSTEQMLVCHWPPGTPVLILWLVKDPEDGTSSSSTGFTLWPSAYLTEPDGVRIWYLSDNPVPTGFHHDRHCTIRGCGWQAWLSALAPEPGGPTVPWRPARAAAANAPGDAQGWCWGLQAWSMGTGGLVPWGLYLLGMPRVLPLVVIIFHHKTGT